MENSAGSWPLEKPVDFRAPPPSPVATGRRSSVTNENVLTEFLEHSLRVPDLILPDKIFPRQKSTITPQTIDYQSLEARKNDVIANAIIDSVAQTGCFQLINHGIVDGLIRSVLIRAVGIFGTPPEKKAAMSRSPEKLWGFEEVHGGDEDGSEISEEFVWCKDERLQLEMEGIWPVGYSKFSEKMETLSSNVEKIAAKILSTIKDNSSGNFGKIGTKGQDFVGSMCYLYKHCRLNVPTEGWVSSLRYDVIRMLIRGSDYSHALCFHLCDGCSEFHVYSKRGWVSFFPEKDALVITIGDQIQTWSDGLYKHVIGRPIFTGDNEKEEDCISMAFLYSPPNIISANNSQIKEEKTISLGQQAMLAILLILVYQFLTYISY